MLKIGSKWAVNAPKVDRIWTKNCRKNGMHDFLGIIGIGCLALEGMSTQKGPKMRRKIKNTPKWIGKRSKMEKERKVKSNSAQNGPKISQNCWVEKS